MALDARAPLAALDERARQSLHKARRHAEALRSPVVGVEHLLLAVLEAAPRRHLRASLPTGLSPSPAHLPFTAGCEAAIQAASDEATGRIGAGDLLLGALRITEEPTVRTLAEGGTTYATALADLQRRRRDGGEAPRT